MRLYHSRHGKRTTQLLILAAWILSGCAGPQAFTQEYLTVTLEVDEQSLEVQVPPGSDVAQVLDRAGVDLGPLDRTQPPDYTVLGDGEEIQVIRVSESFEIVQEVLPFEHQVLHNESLPQERKVLLQRGQNGLQEITIRQLYENGQEVSSAPVKSVVIEEPVPEIVMIGIQTPLRPVAIPGRLVYLRDGNAWMMEASTANRRAVVTTGDLDGRVFSLSEDGSWLLYTRKETGENTINSLWAVNLDDEESEPIDLQVDNIVHFADWVPGAEMKVIFSTVEPRTTAPGWQANNDLHVLTFSTSGWTAKWTTVIESNSGGVYGWWGTTFSWAPDGSSLAFARPDGVYLVDYKDGSVQSLLDIIPLQTRGDWAWTPGISWGPDGQALYSVDHAPPEGSLSPEESQVFDLAAIPLNAGSPLRLVSQTGMFAYPMTAPVQKQAGGETAYQVAYLQAIFPNQSETSRYRVAVMDRDSSDRRILFPAEDAPGIEPQQHWGSWSPSPLPDSGEMAIAVIYQGNLWLIEAASGNAFQVTGDHLTARLTWR